MSLHPEWIGTCPLNNFILVNRIAIWLYWILISDHIITRKITYLHIFFKNTVFPHDYMIHFDVVVKYNIKAYKVFQLKTKGYFVSVIG